jgi:hypothetical protein
MVSEFYEGLLYGSCGMMVLITTIFHGMNYYNRHCKRTSSASLISSFRMVTNYDVLHDEKRILDNENQFSCLVCLETITDPNMPVIECLSCNRYISHIRCFEQWNNRQSVCMYCRS